MPIKSRVTTELGNAFPEWSKTRQDDQSVGKSFLNVIGTQLELLEKELFRAYDNMYLTTAHVGEIDLLYKVTLPNSFEFDVDNTNNLSPVTQPVTISGYVDSGWYLLEEIPEGSIKELWYDAVPTRISEVDTFSISNYLVASGVSSDVQLQLVDSGLDDLNNNLTIVVDGDSLITVDSRNEIQRSKIRITGETWKGTNETEELVFLFADSKQTFKAWNSITKVEPISFVSESTIDVYSHAFNQDRYLDSFDSISQFEDTRENLPYFWALSTTIGNYSVLELQRYATQKAIHLLTTKPVFTDIRRWELLDEDEHELNIEDIALLPYQKRILAITNDTLYLYDTDEELADITVLNQKTSNALVDIETSSDYCCRSDEIEVNLVFKRPIKTIVRHRLKIEYPDGSSFGIMSDGTLVPTTSDYYVYGETSDRFIRPSLFIELDDLGQYNLTLECVYFDETVEIAQRAVLVQAKTPLATFDLSDITDTAVGVDVDHLNRILVLDESNQVHHIMFHYDLAIVDYQNKEILVREEYDQVKVIK